MTGASGARQSLVVGLRTLVLDLGYEPEEVLSDYAYMSDGDLSSVDIAAFAGAPLDMSRAVLVAGAQDGQGDQMLEHLLGAATALAAPAAILATHDGYEIVRTERREVLQHLPHGDRLSAQLVDALRADRLLQAKLRHPTPSLFDIDVMSLSRARRNASERLRDRVVDARRALELSAHHLDYRLTPESRARLLIDALTSLFIEDKFQVSYGSDEWRMYVDLRFSHLRDDLAAFSEATRALFDVIRNHLRVGIDYRSLDSVVVADLYEPRLVDPGVQDQYGVVYTPFELATRVLDNLPIELLRPEQRNVLDFACGSGTLLLAAHERLAAALSPQRLNPEQRHNYLVGKLRGWDRDPFAVQLTHLSLTLQSEPLGNGWNVATRDTLDVHDNDLADVLVANPPWGGRRVGAERSVRQRDDAVTPFVLKTLQLVRPGGQIALFLPASWLTAQHSEAARAEFNRVCEVLEVWRLPEGAFPPANVKGAVLLARLPRTGRSNRPYISRRFSTDASLQALYERGRSDRVMLVPQREARAGFAGTGPASALLRVDAEGQRMADAVTIRSGPPRGHGAFAGQTYRWMGNVRLMDHFGSVTAANTQPALYPGDFDEGAGWDPTVHYEAPKLLISRVRRSNNPWRVKLGLALQPVIPSNNQYALSVRDGIGIAEPGLAPALHALATIWGSALIAAYIDERVTTGNLPSAVVANLALPDGWLALSPLGQGMAEAVERNASLAERSELARTADRAVFELYEVPQSVQDYVQGVVAGARAPEGAVRYPNRTSTAQLADAPARERPSTIFDGVVLAAADGQVTLWVDQLTPDDGITMPLPALLPAAAFLPDVTLKVRPVDQQLGAAEFALHRSSYKDIEELLPTPLASS